MRVVVAAVGAPRDRALAAAIRDYETRAERYWRLVSREVREERARGRGVREVREREGERLLATVGAGSHVIACDAAGDELTSEEFAAWLSGLRERAISEVTFLLGGAFGLATGVREAAARRLAFSRWTLPHELARLVLAEQLYRAGTILRGEPYHK